MKILVLILSLVLCACAQTPTRVDIPGPDNSASVPVNDLRPANEKASEIFSLLISSSGYGIYRKGDETLDPPITQIFRRRAYEKLGADGKKLDISIRHMVVYLNMKSQLRKGAMGAIGGAVGGAIAGGIAATSTVNLSESLVDRNQFDAAGGEEYERAFYTETENPQKASVFVIYIDTEVNGKSVFTKAMAPIEAPAGQNPYVLAVESAIQYHLSQY